MLWCATTSSGCPTAGGATYRAGCWTLCSGVPGRLIAAALARGCGDVLLPALLAASSNGVCRGFGCACARERVGERPVWRVDERWGCDDFVSSISSAARVRPLMYSSCGVRCRSPATACEFVLVCVLLRCAPVAAYGASCFAVYYLLYGAELLEVLRRAAQVLPVFVHALMRPCACVGVGVRRCLCCCCWWLTPWRRPLLC